MEAEGRMDSASSMANSTMRCSSGACSGPKQMSTRSCLSSLVTPRACMYEVPGNGSIEKNSNLSPCFPRTPDFNNSAIQSSLRVVALVCSMGVSVDSTSTSSAAFLTTGAGTASTVKGPVMRRRLLSTKGWSYKVSCAGGSLLAILFNVTCGTVLYLKPLSTPWVGCANW